MKAAPTSTLGRRCASLSWHLLRGGGAGVADIAYLVGRHRPDLALLQEARTATDALPGLLGGHFVRKAMPRRDHGLAAWSPCPFRDQSGWSFRKLVSSTCQSQSFGPLLPRLVLVVRLGTMQVATVHLGHGQRANRRHFRQLLDRQPWLDNGNR